MSATQKRPPKPQRASHTSPPAGSPLAEFIRRRKVRFWGTDHMVTPRLLEHVDGDGKLVIFVTPLATRPNRYVLRVDSKWAKGELNDDAWHDHMGEIYTDLEDGFGLAEETYEHDNGRTYHKHNYWPALDYSCGSTWGIYAKLKKADRRTESQIRAEMRGENISAEGREAYK